MVCRLLTLSTLFLGNSRHLINLHSVRKRSKLYENHMASPVCREKPDLTPSVLQDGWVPTLGLIPARPVIHFHCPSTQKKALCVQMQLSLGYKGVVPRNVWRERWGWDHHSGYPGHPRPFVSFSLSAWVCFPRRLLAARLFPQVPLLCQTLACCLLLLQHCPLGGQPLLAASTGHVTIPL